MRERKPWVIPETVADNERVYDEQIYPLMDQIVAICKEYQIPMVASFVYAPEKKCSTNLAGPESDMACNELRSAASMILNGFSAFTITSRPR